MASQVLLGALSLFIFLAYGTTAAVGRLIGAGDHRRAAQQAVQGLWLAAVVGAVLAVVAYAFADPLLRLLGAGSEVLANGRVYLRIGVFGLPAMLITLAGVGYLRGLQDTLRPLKVAVVTAVLNLALELVLIFGLGFGIGASALSTVVAQWLAASAYVWWIRQAVAAHGVTLAPGPLDHRPAGGSGFGPVPADRGAASVFHNLGGGGRPAGRRRASRPRGDLPAHVLLGPGLGRGGHRRPGHDRPLFGRRRAPGGPGRGPPHDRMGAGFGVGGHRGAVGQQALAAPGVLQR